MISKHSAHLTPLPFGIRTWLWRYTYLLLLISMLWHRQAIFESKGDKLSSSAECRIRTQRVSETQSSADHTHTRRRARAHTHTSNPRPHDAAYCLLTHHWQVHEIIFPPYLAYIRRNCLGMDVNNLELILVQVMTCHCQTAYSNKLKQTEQDILNPSAEILVIWLFYFGWFSSWPWPWIFKVKYRICYISAKNGPIATKQKANILIEL